MKRASVNFDQFHVNDGGESKSKYQILLKEYLKLQKEFVARKRKVQAAKRKRGTILAEVRFLRQRHKLSSMSKAPDIDRHRVYMKNSDLEGKALEEERFYSTSDIAPRILDQFLKKEGGEGYRQVVGEELTFSRNSKNHSIHDKGLGRRKISWPDQVTLKV